MINKYILSINALRARSGGAISHLKGILSSDHFSEYFNEVHVWVSKEVVHLLPSHPSLIVHCPISTNNILFQLFWEYFVFNSRLASVDTDILLNVDAGTVGFFSPSVTMSRDMLAFEDGEASRYGFNYQRIRQFFLRFVQCRSLRNSNAAIFLTKYASNVIQNKCGPVSNFTIIPHGVSESFRLNVSTFDICAMDRTIRLLYVSPIWLFKHQWHVIHAVKMLRDSGVNCEITFIGGGDKVSLNKFNRAIRKYDLNGSFVKYLGHVAHSDLPSIMSEFDIFIFASSCENMPNSLIEAMAMGFPICCSNRGPMPEVISDAGLLFDPESPESLRDSLFSLIKSNKLRADLSAKSLERSKSFSWDKNASHLFSYLYSIRASLDKVE